MSWVDGYECYDTSDVDSIASGSDPDHPSLVLLAHDGDNAFGGGYSYYEQCVKNFVDEAQKKVPDIIPFSTLTINHACSMHELNYHEVLNAQHTIGVVCNNSCTM